MLYETIKKEFKERQKKLDMVWDLFEKNDYIMSPTLFNNIYKGALGEVVGRYLFWRVLNLKMEEISEPELFELFDYKAAIFLFILISRIGMKLPFSTKKKC